MNTLCFYNSLCPSVRHSNSKLYKILTDCQHFATSFTKYFFFLKYLLYILKDDFIPTFGLSAS